MLLESFTHASSALYHLTVDFILLLGSLLQSRSALAAENLFLCKQLGLYQERQVRPRRASDATRLALVLLGSFFEWKDALRVVRPETFIGWHRNGFKLFWRWKSRPIGRPRIPKDLRQLILTMTRDNPTWGQARIAAELCLKLGIQVSPRTVRKYLLEDPNGYRRRPDPSQRWMTFVRRGCLDFLIPMSESHLRRMVKRWQIHYNQARPHSSLGPGLPEPRPGLPVPPQKDRHQIPEGYRVTAKPILCGLHHEYGLEKIAA